MSIKNHAYTLKFDKDTYEWLQREMQKDDRPISSIIRIAVKQYREKKEGSAQ